MRYIDTATENRSRLGEWLTSHLADASFVAMRTGFTSARGVNLVLDRLKSVLDRGGRIEVVAGGTADQPDPEALLALESLVRSYPGQASVRVVTAPNVFQNAKTYYVRTTGGQTAAWVGSANLTYGGLETNHEAAVVFDADDPGDLKDQVLQGIQAYADDNSTEPLTVDTIRRLENQRVDARGDRHNSLPPLGATAAPGDLIVDMLEGISAIASNDRQPVGIPTRVDDLDAITGGLHPGQLIVIAGRPAAGTSTLLTDFARSCSIKHNLPSLVFSMQCSRDELTQRILSAEAKIRLNDMRSGRMNDDDWTRLTKNSQRVADSPLLLNCSPAAHIDALYDLVVDLAASRQLRAVFIDGLNSIRATVEPGASREREVSAIVRQLKVLALQLQIPIVVTAELGKSVDQRTDRMPLMSDFRESDTIAQVADNVIFVHQPDQVDYSRMGEADLILAKNRTGPTATIAVAHLRHYCCFGNLVYPV
jgi:HKD family nuclease/cytidylate kinase